MELPYKLVLTDINPSEIQRTIHCEEVCLLNPLKATLVSKMRLKKVRERKLENLIKITNSLIYANLVCDR